MSEKPSKDNLQTCALDMNKVLQLNPPIKIGRRATVDQLIADITESADLLRPGDTLTPESVVLLQGLGLAVPGPVPSPAKTPEGIPPVEVLAGEEETKEPETTPDAFVDNSGELVEPPPVTKPHKPKKVKAPKATTYNRMASVIDAVKAGVKDRDDLIVTANELYIKAGKRDNMKESTWAVNIAVDIFDRIGYKWIK